MTTGEGSGNPDLDSYVRDEVYQQARQHVLGATSNLAQVFEDEHRSSAATHWQEWQEQVVDPLKPVAMDDLDFRASLKHKGVLISIGVGLTYVLDKNDDKKVTVDKADLSAANRLETVTGPYSDNPNAGAVAAASRLGITVHNDFHQPMRTYGQPTRRGYYIQCVHKTKLVAAANTQLGKDWTKAKVVGVGFAVKPRQQKGSGALAEGVVLDPAVSPNKVEGHKNQIANLNPYSLLGRDISGSSLREGRFGSLELTADEVIELAETSEGIRKLEQEIRKAAEIQTSKVQKTVKLTQRVLEAITESDDYRAKRTEAKKAA